MKLTAEEKLVYSSVQNNSLLCIGMDIDENLIPPYLHREANNASLLFNKLIIEHTYPLVCAYKFNMAFYECREDGFQLLTETLRWIPPHIPVILDGKRGDIGNTAKHYAKTMFDRFNADATTVNPYMGTDSIQPFVDYPDKMTFVLAATSNSSAGQIQKMEDHNPVYHRAAMMAAALRNKPGATGLVIGANEIVALKNLREILPDMWFLVPGIGVQGGNIETVMKHGVEPLTGSKVIINVSRSILYASRENDFYITAQNVARNLRDEINKHRNPV
jgi:orotidine-5'-phosphate decarboxylase